MSSVTDHSDTQCPFCEARAMLNDEINSINHVSENMATNESIPDKDTILHDCNHIQEEYRDTCTLNRLFLSSL